METLLNSKLTLQYAYIDSSERILLRDGTPVLLRPMRPSDVDLLADMHERLSADTLFFRYLHPYKPTRDELARYADIDSRQGAAFVAVVDSVPKKVVGIAMYCRDSQDPAVAQPAFLIQDDFQGRGLGHALFTFLIQHALSCGISTLDVTVHPSNARMMRLIQKSGLPYQATLEYGAVEMRVSLSPAPVPA